MIASRLAILIFCTIGTEALAEPLWYDDYVRLTCKWWPSASVYMKKMNDCRTIPCLFYSQWKESRISIPVFEEHPLAVEHFPELQTILESYRITYAVTDRAMVEVASDYVDVVKGLSDDDAMRFWGGYLSSFLGYNKEMKEIFDQRDIRYNAAFKVFSEFDYEFANCP